MVFLIIIKITRVPPSIALSVFCFQTFCFLFLPLVTWSRQQWLQCLDGWSNMFFPWLCLYLFQMESVEQKKLSEYLTREETEQMWKLCTKRLTRYQVPTWTSASQYDIVSFRDVCLFQNACAVRDWGMGLQRSDSEDESPRVHTTTRNRGLRWVKGHRRPHRSQDTQTTEIWDLLNEISSGGRSKPTAVPPGFCRSWLNLCWVTCREEVGGIQAWRWDVALVLFLSVSWRACLRWGLCVHLSSNGPMLYT